MLQEILGSRALLLPSSQYGEGQAGVIIEALQLNTPVITFNIGGAEDFLHINQCVVLDSTNWEGVEKLIKKSILECDNFPIESTGSIVNSAQEIHQRVLDLAL